MLDNHPHRCERRCCRFVVAWIVQRESHQFLNAVELLGAVAVHAANCIASRNHCQEKISEDYLDRGDSAARIASFSFT